MSLDVHADLKAQFPGLQALTSHVQGVMVERQNPELESFKMKLIEKVRERYDLESLRDQPTFRAYRDFFWRIGIDPTKNRPAAEALIRRIVGGKPLPRINTLVDAYNLASIQTEVALAAFDADRLNGSLLMRYARRDEEFLGIGMRKSINLKGGEIVVSDGEKLVAIYPYRDAENTKVTTATRNCLLLVCGVPGIRVETLLNAERVAIDYITRFCGREKGK